MARAQKNVSNTANTIDLDTLDAALATLDVAGAAEPEVIEDLEELQAIADETIEEILEENEVIEASDVLDDDVLTDLDIALERKDAYEAQESTPVESVEKQELPPRAAKPARKPRGTATASSSPKTHVPRDINTVADEFFVLSGDIVAMSDEDKAAAKTETLGKIPSQVKVAEKFENLFTALSVGKEPSTYTMIAFGALDAKKTITSLEIVAAYKATGLGEGTARSQSGQMMALFPIVGIATRAGQTLTMLPDSNVAERIRGLSKPAAPAPAATTEPEVTSESSDEEVAA